LLHQRASSSPEAGGWLPGSYGVGIGFLARFACKLAAVGGTPFPPSPWQGRPERLADAPPSGRDGVAGSRPSVRACGSGARGDENRDRGSHFTAPPHYDPAVPSHVPCHSLKGMTAVLLGRREMGAVGCREKRPVHVRADWLTQLAW
jgi:hypothetical protein